MPDRPPGIQSGAPPVMQRTYTVDVIGFNETERIVLGSIFNLSATRSPSYSSFTRIDPAGLEHPDLYLVDSDDHASVVALLRRNGDGKIPTLLVGDDDHNTGWSLLARPLQWARLFAALDAAIPNDANGANGANGATLASAQPGVVPESCSPPLGELPPARISSNANGPAPVAAQVPQFQGERVLVVDDSPTVRQFMENKLAALGLTVDVASSGEQAIGMAAHAAYACVFLDVGLPGIDGYQVCRLLKSPRSLARAPVIMLTARSSPLDRWRAIWAGCDAYLTKPVENRRFNVVLARVLARGNGDKGKPPREQAEAQLSEIE